MAKVTFDGPNKRFHVETGYASLDVMTDIYSAWIDWYRTDEGSKYLPAFSTSGGEPTSAGQVSPRYFFLINGWKGVVDSLSIQVGLNLYSDDGQFPFYVLNGGNVSLNNSDLPGLDILNKSLYNQKVCYDENSGYSGTSFPVGTDGAKVNNLADAIAICEEQGFRTIEMFSNLTLDRNISDMNFYAYSGNYIFNANGFKAHMCFLRQIKLEGDFNSSFIAVEKCYIGNIYNVYGMIDNCKLLGEIKLASAQSLSVDNCESAIPGNMSPTIDMNDIGSSSLNLRRYAGGILIKNCFGTTDVATLEGDGAKIRLHNSCTGGLLSIRGTGKLYDDSQGTTVETEAWIETQVRNAAVFSAMI
jgi:hypothetical protein